MESAAPSEFQWPPLESNPEIFTEYLRNIGLPMTWQIGELFGFDEDCLGFAPRTTIAVIANVERLKKQDDKAKGSTDVAVDYYMKQTGKLDNACGIIACLHAVLNNLG